MELVEGEGIRGFLVGCVCVRNKACVWWNDWEELEEKSTTKEYEKRTEEIGLTSEARRK